MKATNGKAAMKATKAIATSENGPVQKQEAAPDKAPAKKIQVNILKKPAAWNVWAKEADEADGMEEEVEQEMDTSPPTKAQAYAFSEALKKTPGTWGGLPQDTVQG